jgi:mannose-6-phosphate isomerase-like protein (cupin superfamily)
VVVRAQLWMQDVHAAPVSSPVVAGIVVGRSQPTGMRSAEASTEWVEGGMLGWSDNIERATIDNDTFRTVLRTGLSLQLTVMSLQPGEDIGVEVHPDLDQFIRVEQGEAEVQMGRARDDLSESHRLGEDWAVIIPGGTWHNVVNRGTSTLKLYSIYAPPEHPDGAVHHTKADAEAAEAEHHS